MRVLVAVLAVVVVGCGRSGLNSDDPTAPAAEAVPRPAHHFPAPLLPLAPSAPSTSSCRVEAFSDFPGVSFEFPAQRCVFTEAEVLAGIAFQYALVVDAATAPNLESSPSTRQSCPMALPGAGVFVFGHVVGPGKEYCLCDEGRCASAAAPPASAGRTLVSFPWNGREWFGPSDFGNPPGAPFGPGDYTFEVEAQVADARADMLPVWVRGTLFFSVVP